jgi:hypothetical protein
MPTKAKDFLELRNALYQRGERLWTWSVAANAAALVAVLVSLMVAPDGCVGVVAAAAMACPALAVVLRELAAIPTDRADAIRQLILLSDSLGRPIPAADQAKVRRWVPHAELGPAPYVAPYYASTLPAGASRLADNLAETAYFTEHLAEKVATGFAIAAALALAMLVAAVYVAASTPSATAVLPILTKGAVTVIVFFIFGDCSVLAWRFLRLKLAAGEAFKGSCELRRDAGADLSQALPLFQNYESARVQAPPIPGWLHRRYMDELNADYRQSHSATGV